MMNQIMRDLLVCPQCKGKLMWRESTQELLCITDKLAFPVRDNIPVMLLAEARPLTSAELEPC